MPSHNLSFDPTVLQSDDTLTGILQRLQDLYNQPVIPNNPMAQAGSIMSGFAAGVKGQPNPAIEQAMEQRKTLFTQALGQANLALSMRREASLESQRKSQVEQFEKTETRLKEQFKASQAQNKLQMGFQHDIPGLIEQGAREENASGVVTWTDAQIQGLKNAPARAALVKDKESIAARLLADPNDIEAAGLDQAMATMAKNETGRAALMSRWKITDPHIRVMQDANEKQKLSLEAERVNANKQIAAGKVDPKLFVQAGREYNQTTRLTLAYLAKEVGTLEQHPELKEALKLHDLEVKNAVQAGKAHELTIQLKQAELNAVNKHAPREVFETLLKETANLANIITAMIGDPKVNPLTLQTLRALHQKLTVDLVNAMEEEGKKSPQLKAIIDAAKGVTPSVPAAKPTGEKPLRKRIEESGSVPGALRELLKPTHQVEAPFGMGSLF